TATAARACAALDGAATAHLACHGHFRSDSPLFSSLQLADGPLNVYELQRLRVAPGGVVLSACDLAPSTLPPGDGLLGLAPVLRRRARGDGNADDRGGPRSGAGRGGEASDASLPPRPRGGSRARSRPCPGPGRRIGSRIRLSRQRLRRIPPRPPAAFRPYAGT